MSAQPAAPAFGSVFAASMAVMYFDGTSWTEPKVVPVEPIPMHPASHALHYGSTIFEGLKAHKGTDGIVRIFRPDRHAQRMTQSAARLYLACPDAETIHGLMRDAVRANITEVPSAPGSSLYLRPTLIGTTPNIGAAAAPSTEVMLYVLCSPVGDYFAGGLRPLKLLVETEQPRTTPLFGSVKCGANYVQALPPTLRAKRELGVDQVLFAPGGDVQETGAANFLLIDDERVVTKALDTSFLHGVTRDSILRLAEDMGYVVEERDLSVNEVVAWAARGGEAALSGTAAVLSPVGTLLVGGEEVTVGDGGVGPNVLKLRDALTALQRGEAEDTHGWLEAIG